MKISEIGAEEAEEQSRGAVALCLHMRSLGIIITTNATTALVT